MFRLVHKQLGSCRLKLYFFLCETRTVTCFFFLRFSVFFFFWKILLAIKLKLKIKIKKNIILTDFYWFNVYIAAVVGLVGLAICITISKKLQQEEIRLFLTFCSHLRRFTNFCATFISDSQRNTILLNINTDKS